MQQHQNIRETKNRKADPFKHAEPPPPTHPTVVFAAIMQLTTEPEHDTGTPEPKNQKSKTAGPQTGLQN